MKIKQTHPNFKTPKQEVGSIGIDCFVAEITQSENYIEYNLGFQIEPPQGTWVMLVPRSSISTKPLIGANSPGIIDPNYRGDLKFRVKYLFHGEDDGYELYKIGDKCCQLILMPAIYSILDFVIDGELSSTNRGEGGFGSSGNH